MAAAGRCGPRQLYGYRSTAVKFAGILIVAASPGMVQSMTRIPDIGPDLKRTLRRVDQFEASPSIPDTGTGARREGKQFELLCAGMWTEFCHRACDLGAERENSWVKRRHYTRLRLEERELWVPTYSSGPAKERDARWLEVSFRVKDLVTSYPGTNSAIERYAPPSGEFSGTSYPRMYEHLETKFDDTVLMIDNGTLIEKILLEYKTAKSGKNNNSLVGNAHERLSFQIMQYLEIATRYTRCSLVVIANGAFAKYRNKYHVNFHVQSDRLNNFSWFKMDYACTFTEYCRFLESLLSWLFHGLKRPWS